MTQIKPDGDNTSCLWRIGKSLNIFSLFLPVQSCKFDSYLPHFPCYSGFFPNRRPSSCPMASGCVRSHRPAESSWHLLLLMDRLDDCVTRLDIQWLPGSFNQLNQSAVRLMGRLVNVIEGFAVLNIFLLQQGDDTSRNDTQSECTQEPIDVYGMLALPSDNKFRNFNQQKHPSNSCFCVFIFCFALAKK